MDLTSFWMQVISKDETDSQHGIYICVLCVCGTGGSSGGRGSVRGRRPFLRRNQEVEGSVPGGQSQLLPGVSRQPGGERDHKDWLYAPRTQFHSLLLLLSSRQTFVKGVPPRQKLLPTGGAVLTTEEKYMSMVDKCFPDDTSEWKTQ